MKENTLFQLDLLQAFYLQKPARFGVTKQIIRSEKYPSKHKLKNKSNKKHKLLTLSRNEAFDMIKKLQSEAFDKKLHNLENTLYKTIIKYSKKNSSKTKDEKILNFYKNDELIKQNIKHKLFKLILLKFNKYLNVKEDHFEGISNDVIDYIKNLKANNPYKNNGIEINNLMSRIWAEKEVKTILEDVDNLELIWTVKSNKVNNKDKKDKIDINEISDKEIEQNEESDDDGNVQAIRQKNGDNDDDEDYEDMYEGYKNYLAASSDEEDEEEGGNNFNIDPNINYNEITDEEPSDDEIENTSDKKTRKIDTIEEDDFFSSGKNGPDAKRLKKSELDIQMPQLATGYYSGGSEDESESNDKLVDEITQPRKNRRGQRARQKIWEKKYGSTAKHVVKQQERFRSDRERLKDEYEVRQQKREAKQKVRDEKEKQRKEREEKEKERKEFIHPSWAARLKEQEQQKAKFSGKKITFD